MSQDQLKRNKDNLSTGDNEVYTAELNDKSINNHENKLREMVQTENTVQTKYSIIQWSIFIVNSLYTK